LATNSGVWRSRSAGGIANLAAAVGAGAEGRAAQHEFRIQAIAALLQITAVGHLRDHVGGAEQVPKLQVARIVDDDVGQRAFVAGEMRSRRSRPVPEPITGGIPAGRRCRG
jgi:hypothetical protein